MSSNMDKGKYWEEYNAWEEYNDSYLYPERNERDLDAIINSVLNGGKFEENTPKSYDNFECFWEDERSMQRNSVCLFPILRRSLSLKEN